eukprot:GHVL01015184.1.p2 GENE.GHVL01015184.1~~GHVL01015184.1.p2  ORF type:complete len:121 (-),score=10.08 GHVL01015184.1:101-463(-)
MYSKRLIGTVGHLEAKRGGIGNKFGLNIAAAGQLKQSQQRCADVMSGISNRDVSEIITNNDILMSCQTWTRELCQKDSDEDGKTNGQELGDPDCTWTPNSLPPLDTGLSHPGQCIVLCVL